MTLIEAWGGPVDVPVDASGSPAPELVESWLPDDPFELLALGHAVIDKLNAVGLSSVPEPAAMPLVSSVDELARRAAALDVDAAALVDGRGHERAAGFFSTRSCIKHRLQLSGPTALARTQTMRMFALLPSWATAARAGRVGSDQTLLMARVAANPRIALDLIANIDALLHDAIRLPFDEFERLLRNFERAADPADARASAEAANERRDATMKIQIDGSWRLAARFGSLEGARLNEIFAHFIEAEWQSDLAEARERAAAEGGGEPGTRDLRRSESQRRADALSAALQAAAAAPGPGKPPLPSLNVLIDESTLRGAILGHDPDPAAYASMVCRTQAGDPVDITEAAAMALWADVRRVVHDGAGVVIDLGRRRRLFTGSAREAALLLSMRCLWPGCDRPSRNCEVDHAVTWRQHGATDPGNGGPMCKRHNLLKENARFSTHRDAAGDWVVLDADGHPVG
ncbi:HNH endonuclease signature motif containing protein [Ilumatobacter coccineus]|uniref:HNH nuclease domain-containing protein n=1 Tax=Ilumatobacter coccineus (strain NBRC 103263 / KCTC 29153 / YM16-304) TaxID=1313172 RepID=A0A6C7DZY8_ILUCY|nr:HNH endonuclease signature motif containing protein [Ilumatobacter coccineus]BAN01634.1 hypothetical protein YM304_13200 [Ilumatobacter coccineus YM16-304]